MQPITVTPIGVIRTAYREKPDTPRQPGVAVKQTVGVITLTQGRGFEQALCDLGGFEYVWVVSWFDQVRTWKPKVLPPRSRTRRGLFATRSPHRPNPIGISLCRLISVEGRRIRVECPDLLDGTPILDIKPYLPAIEARPDSASGWVQEVDANQTSGFDVSFKPEAEDQLNWLRNHHGVDLRERISAVLSWDPLPHSYRRIKRVEGGGFVQSIHSWRVYFSVEDRHVVVQAIGSGYRTDVLLREDTEEPEIQIHRAFLRRQF